MTMFASSRSAVFIRSSSIVPGWFQDCRSDQRGSAVNDMKTTAMFVLLLALCSSFQLIIAGESKNASQPHIIFILADDLVSS